MAKKLNRRFVAFELSEDYANEARKRLAAIKIGDPLDGVARQTVRTRSLD